MRARNFRSIVIFRAGTALESAEFALYRNFKGGIRPFARYICALLGKKDDGRKTKKEENCRQNGKAAGGKWNENGPLRSSSHAAPRAGPGSGSGWSSGPVPRTATILNYNPDGFASKKSGIRVIQSILQFRKNKKIAQKT